MGTGNINITRADMEAALGNLSQYADEFLGLTGNMTTSVNLLCDGWESDASEIYRQDFTALTESFKRTVEVVQQLIQSTQNYMNDMSSVDQSYAHNHVSF